MCCGKYILVCIGGNRGADISGTVQRFLSGRSNGGRDVSIRIALFQQFPSGYSNGGRDISSQPSAVVLLHSYTVPNTKLKQRFMPCMKLQRFTQKQNSNSRVKILGHLNKMVFIPLAMGCLYFSVLSILKEYGKLELDWWLLVQMKRFFLYTALYFLYNLQGQEFPKPASHSIIH